MALHQMGPSTDVWPNVYRCDRCGRVGHTASHCPLTKAPPAVRRAEGFGACAFCNMFGMGEFDKDGTRPCLEQRWPSAAMTLQDDVDASPLDHTHQTLAHVHVQVRSTACRAGRRTQRMRSPPRRRPTARPPTRPSLCPPPPTPPRQTSPPPPLAMPRAVAASLPPPMVVVARVTATGTPSQTAPRRPTAARSHRAWWRRWRR